MFNKLLGKFSKDLGIDLGTSNTLVHVRDRGIVVNEPSVVALNTKTDQVLAIGDAAKNMVGKTPAHLTVSRPLEKGIIADFEVAEKMLKYFIDRIHQESINIIPRPRVVIGIPMDVTEVERKAVEDAALFAGAREVFLVEKAMANAIGMRIPIEDPAGNMIVDLGGGLTEIAVISLGGIVNYKALDIAGRTLDDDIINYVKEEFKVFLGESMAELAKIKIGAIYEIENPMEMEVRGRDLNTGLPRQIVINSYQIRDALYKSIRSIVDSIKATLEVTPPALVADIYERGIILTGGGALLRGIDKLISEETEIPVHVTEDPLTCVVRGTAIILEDQNLLKNITIPSPAK